MAVPVLRWASRLAAVTIVALMLAFPAGVAAVTNEPIAQTGGMTATLPLLGTSLTVDVSLDAAGNISDVTLDPAGALEKKKTSPETVKFSNTAGTTKVTVRAKGSSLSIKARAKLTDLVGTGTWSADVFGTGAKSTVQYTIGNNGGKPAVTIGTVTTPPGVTSAVIAPMTKVMTGTTGSAKHGKGNGHGALAVGGVTFSHDGFVKRLLISVSVGKDGVANLKITLSGKDRQKLSGTLAELAGTRTWKGHLAAGTKVSVTYHVTAEATVVFDGATGAKATSRATRHGLVVKFNGTGVGVKIRLVKKGDGDTYALVVRGFGPAGRHQADKDHSSKNGSARSGAVYASYRGGSHGGHGGHGGGNGGGH